MEKAKETTQWETGENIKQEAQIEKLLLTETDRKGKKNRKGRCVLNEPEIERERKIERCVLNQPLFIFWDRLSKKSEENFI